ncbi:MAG: TonB-dependent receptor [Tannerellaceae bacterium]|nr:TonB-dependent receptor [Tannerellaceae bacterium]
MPTPEKGGDFQNEAAFEQGIVRSLNFRADAYYNEVTDKIIAVPKGNGQYRWMMMNLGYVEIRGVDISGQVSWHFSPHITASSTWANATITLPTSAKTTNNPGTPTT